jgi:geranylgeranyl diphosphate synthase type I
MDKLTQKMLAAIEEELKAAVDGAAGPGLSELHQMLSYHMGWEGEGSGPEARGKRIRPLMVLLSAAAAGTDWEKAIPAAAATELIHNFSLIHDDIEDKSPLRRGRPTLWTKWGVPQAINAGDCMFTLAHLKLLELERMTTPETALKAARLLQKTCLHLTQGQYLDIAYEKRGDLDLEAYWPMVSGKTAALLSACTELGARVAGVSEETCLAYADFGRYLGLAFQAQDDLLGIWGDAALTGKSAESDLLSGKKSLPVLYGLDKRKAFAERWAQGAVTVEEVAGLASTLEQEGAYEYTQERAIAYTEQALAALEKAKPQGEAGEILFNLAKRLVDRKV